MARTNSYVNTSEFSKRTGSSADHSPSTFSDDVDADPTPCKLSRTLSGAQPIGDFVMASSLMSPTMGGRTGSVAFARTPTDGLLRTPTDGSAGLLRTPTMASADESAGLLRTPTMADADEEEAPDAPVKAKKNKDSDGSSSPPLRRRRISTPELNGAADTVVNGLDSDRMDVAKEVDLTADEHDIQSIEEINNLPVSQTQPYEEDDATLGSGCGVARSG